MRHTTLGRSGLVVTDLSLGTMIFGEPSGRSTPPDVAHAMIDQYLDAGGNFIDTANVYAGGRSEEIVGQALAGKRDGVIIATKGRFRTGPGLNQIGLSRHNLVHAVHASLRRLQTDVIDLYYVHMWDPWTPIEETLRALDDLVTAGKIRYLGVSNFKAWQLMKALAVSDANGYARFIAAQYQHSLVVRDIEREFIDLFLTEGIGSVPWGPLGGGFLSGKYTPGDQPTEGRLATTPDHDEEAWSRRSTDHNWAILAVVDEIAAEHDATHAQVAINWLRQRTEVNSVILGVRTPEQLADNLAAADWLLTEDELDQLESVSAYEPGYPYRMLALYGKRE